MESRIGQGIRERTLKAQQCHGWKTGGEGEKFLSGLMLWGRSNPDPAAVRVSITSLCRGAEQGLLLYALETDDLRSVLQIDQLGAEERRLSVTLLEDASTSRSAKSLHAAIGKSDSWFWRAAPRR